MNMEAQTASKTVAAIHTNYMVSYSWESPSRVHAIVMSPTSRDMPFDLALGHSHNPDFQRELSAPLSLSHESIQTTKQE
jgi:hypothetical protein